MAAAGVITMVVALAACDRAESHTSGTMVAVTSGGPIAPIADYVPNMVRCLTAKHWIVVDAHDGSFETPDGIPNDQEKRYESDVVACKSTFGYDRLPPPKLTAEQAGQLYDQLLRVAGCVRGLGYPVADPPSKQAFVGALATNPIPIWHPYQNAVQQDGPVGLEKVEKACPVPGSGS